MARGRYLARMDADDLAVPNTRLAEQVAFMEAHPEVGLLSGDMTMIGPDGAFLEGGQAFYKRPASHGYLRWRLLWGNPISHITVLIRREVLQKHQLTYQPSFNTAEDYELWATLSHLTRLERAAPIGRNGVSLLAASPKPVYKSKCSSPSV